MTEKVGLGIITSCFGTEKWQCNAVDKEDALCHLQFCPTHPLEAAAVQVSARCSPSHSYSHHQENPTPQALLQKYLFYFIIHTIMV